jgi:hypothetical protein
MNEPNEPENRPKALILKVNIVAQCKGMFPYFIIFSTIRCHNYINWNE